MNVSRWFMHKNQSAMKGKKAQMKKLLILLLTVTVCLSLGVPTFAEDKHEITSESFPLYMGEMQMGIDLPLYFLDGVNDLPYIDFKDFQEYLLQNLFDDYATGIDVQFTTEEDDPTLVCRRLDDTYHILMTIDFDENTIEFADYNLFCQRAGSSTILDSVTLNVVDEAGDPVLLEKVDTDSYTRFGDELTFTLGDYDIDLIHQDGLYLVPLQTRRLSKRLSMTLLSLKTRRLLTSITSKVLRPALSQAGRNGSHIIRRVSSVLLSYIFGAAEAKDEAADRPEEEQHKAKADSMAKYLGQLEGLDNVKDKCNNAAHTGNDSLPRGSVCPDSHKAGQKGHHQEEKSKESAPADVIFHNRVKNRNDGLPAALAGLMEDLPVCNDLKD